MHRALPAFFLVFLLACAQEGEPRRPVGPRTDTDPVADTDDTDVVDTDDTDDTGCPQGMADVDGRICIDRYEARLQTLEGADWVDASPFERPAGRQRAVPAQGQVPQGYISGSEAASACAEAGKRLCTSDEWLLACQGPQASTYPYGNAHREGACNDRYGGGHPVVDYFGTSEGVWDGVHMNDPGINQQPGTVAPGGAYDACVSVWGIYDLHGNLHEWVADDSGVFRGGFYADSVINGPGCLYRTSAHDRAYHDYSTGFRCCSTR
jgi:hypothetical protein